MLARASSALRGRHLVQTPSAAVLPGSAVGSCPAHAPATVTGCDRDVGALAFPPQSAPAAAAAVQALRRHQSQAVGGAEGQDGMEPANQAADRATPHQPPLVRNAFLDPGRSGAAGAQSSTVVAVLNWTLPECTSRLLQSAHVRVCVDGGSNQLFDVLPRRQPDLDPAAVRLQHLPHAVIGDMDSAREEVLQFYRSHGAEVVSQGEDQDSTDLGKCLAYLERRLGERQLRRLTVVVLGAMGGRIDHAIANLNALVTHPHLNLVLVGDKSTARLLPAGRSRVAPLPGVEGPHCSLVPLTGPCNITTSGLTWNMTNQEMRFGGLVSTSNKIEGDIVEVNCDRQVLWTTEFDDHL